MGGNLNGSCGYTWQAIDSTDVSLGYGVYLCVAFELLYLNSLLDEGSHYSELFHTTFSWLLLHNHWLQESNS